jgi:hypothetical protein
VKAFDEYHLSAELAAACASGQSTSFEEVIFDFRPTATALARIPRPLDWIPFHELIDPRYVFDDCVLSVIPCEDAESFRRRESSQKTCFRFPWVATPSPDEAERSILRFAGYAQKRGLGLSARELEQRAWECFNSLIRVQAGDTIRSSLRSERVETEDPFVHPADRYSAKITLELWRGQHFVCAAISPLEIVSGESTFARGVGLLRTLEKRIRSRSLMARSILRPGAISGPGSSLEPSSTWDEIALQLFGAYQRIDEVTAAIFDDGLKSPFLRSRRRMRDLMIQLFEEGTKFGRASMDIEVSERMRPEALKHHQRRQDGKAGAAISARKKTQSAADVKRKAQELADSLWQRHPNWSKAAIARKIAKKVGRSESSVRQGLKKPAKERS